MPVYDQEKQDKEKSSVPGTHDDLGVPKERKEAETDDLEKLYNAESRAAEDRNTPSSRAESKEKSGLSSEDEPDSPWETNTKKPKKRRFSITGRRAAIGGGVAGLVVGSSIAITGFLSGPLQFIHFAQVLSSFHFDDTERFGNSRTAKLFRYATNREPRAQDFNLTRTGNRLAIHYEKKLRANGIEIEYGNTGRISKMTVTPDSPAGKQLIQGVEAENGVAMPRDGDGKVRFEFAPNSTEATSAGVRRAMIDGAVEGIGMNKVSTSIAKRMLKARAAVDFHPLKNISRSADERINLRFNEWKKKVLDERAKRIQQGADPPSITSTRTDDPENPATGQDTAEAEKIDKGTQELKNIASDPELSNSAKIGKVKATLGAGIGATAIVGTLCGLDALGDSVGALQEDNTVGPLIRTGMDTVATGSQVQSGKDVNFDELGAIASTFYDPETKSSFMDAESIQTELGNPGVGEPMPESAKPGKDKPAFFKTIDTITAPVSGICGVVNSTLGGLALAVGGIAVTATGPASIAISAASEAGQQVAVNAFIDDLVRFLAGAGLTAAKATGAELGNYANFGAFLANNNAIKGMGGRALTGSERVALTNERNQILRQKNKQKSLYARTLDIRDPYSLVSKSMIQNKNLNQGSASLATIARSPFKVFGMLPASFSKLSPTAQAQTAEYDYGVDEFGFSIAERDNPTVEDPYDNAAQVEPQLDSLNEKYGAKCFGTTIDKTNGEIKYTAAPGYIDLEKNKDMCGPNNQDPMFLKYRMYVADTILAASMTCYEGLDDSSCEQLGLTGAEEATSGSEAVPVDAKGVDTSAQQCQIGQDGGVQNSPVEGIKIRICILEGIDFNVAIEKNVKAILDGARAAGIDFSGSGGFRSYDEQVRLRSVNGCADIFTADASTCSPPTAKPGNSMHEWGLALDLREKGSSGFMRSGSAGFKWMVENQSVHGLKNLPSEPWHWSTTGN